MTNGFSSQDNQHGGLLTKIAREVVHAYDWLSGPAMSERERLSRNVAEVRALGHMDILI